MSINNEDRRCLVGYIFNLHAQICGMAQQDVTVF